MIEYKSDPTADYIWGLQQELKARDEQIKELVEFVEALVESARHTTTLEAAMSNLTSLAIDGNMLIQRLNKHKQ